MEEKTYSISEKHAWAQTPTPKIIKPALALEVAVRDTKNSNATVKDIPTH